MAAALYAYQLTNAMGHKVKIARIKLMIQAKTEAKISVNLFHLQFSSPRQATSESKI
jgi:hypothetical protein